MRKLVNSNFDIQTVLKGKVVFNPVYSEQVIREYRDNPFIESLPQIFNDELIVDKFTIYPYKEESERYQEANIRYHMIKRLKNFIQPLSIHFRIERKLSTMIRRGYMARNPYSKDFLQRLRVINDIKLENDKMKINRLDEISESLRSTAESFSMIGISGIGKTTAIERLLLMYPQVIVHSEYMEEAFTRTQIVWLKIDCPYDGSIKTLCKMFFKAVDDVLGTTNYFNKYGNNRNSAATMMIHMTYIASVYSIGVLVIDEIQHLINKKNSPDEMLNFFVTLVNTIGVPTILIGTPKAIKVLEKDFRQARRAGGEGSIVWDRMEKDEEWDFFLETMWQYQWVSEFTPLSKQLNDVMYEESQGITSVAVNLFLLAQERAIASGVEKISIGLIREVAKNDLKMIQKMIKALRNNNLEEIAKYDDIAINLDDILVNIKQQLDLRGRISSLAKQEQQIRKSKSESIKEQVLTELVNMGLFANLSYNKLEKIVEDSIQSLRNNCTELNIKQFTVKKALEEDERISLAKKARKLDKERNKNIKLENQDLRNLYHKSKERKMSIYEILKEYSYIKNPKEEFLEKKVN